VVMVELCEELFACQRSVVILQEAYVFARRQASLVNKMTGNNKKVWRKISKQEKAKVASDPSSACEDDKVSKLNDLNQIIVKDIKAYFANKSH